MAYNSLYMSSLDNGTPATSPTWKECTYLQKPVVNAILPKGGIICKSPRAILFATYKYGELELDRLDGFSTYGPPEMPRRNGKHDEDVHQIHPT
jgi:hypothetical protein